jgi:hypothetical protein
MGGEGQGLFDGDKDVLREIESRATSVGTIIRLYVLRTEKGFFCMVHIDTAEGDQIAVVDGAKVLLVLCPTGKSVDGTAKFKFVGTAYVHSFMASDPNTQAKKPACQARPL